MVFIYFLLDSYPLNKESPKQLNTCRDIEMVGFDGETNPEPISGKQPRSPNRLSDYTIERF